MNKNLFYVPILKGKEGEYAALEELKDGIKNTLSPVIEVPAVPFDYGAGKQAKSIDEHIFTIPKRIQRSWGSRPFYLDLSMLDGEKSLSDSSDASENILSACRSEKIAAIPVISRKSSQQHIKSVSHHQTLTGGESAIRMVVEDFQEEVDIDAETDRILSCLNVREASTLDLIIDLKDLGSDLSRATLIARSVLSLIPRRDEWRNVILAAASFPKDLSDIDAKSTSLLPRSEWRLWNSLQRRPANLPRRDMVFSDYAISNPVAKELDPRTMRMSASIRYTAEENWLVIKGRNVRQYGFAQYFELCDSLIERAEYAGRNFSWGDKFISDCAEGTQGPGNATTWRKVGVNHHLTLVSQQIANSHLAT